jgi:hypothetical protein
MTFSTTPLLVLAICAFWGWAARASRSRGEITGAQARAIYAWLAILVFWGIATSLLAIGGGYRSAGFYRLLPGFWVPLAPVFISAALLALWPTFRSALWIVTGKTSPRAFMLVHSLRIAAIGGIVKASQGLLPASFAYPVGIPDFAFGLLSLTLFLLGGRGYTIRTLVAWNLAGIAVLLAAPVLMQMGLPGPLHLLAGQPDARALFEFPMVLAPTLVVTWLFFMNGWHTLVLAMSRRSPQGVSP